jgi:hypothetical protein
MKEAIKERLTDLLENAAALICDPSEATEACLEEAFTLIERALEIIGEQL